MFPVTLFCYRVGSKKIGEYVKRFIVLMLSLILVGCVEKDSSERDHSSDDGADWDGSTEEPWGGGGSDHETGAEAPSSAECTEPPVIIHDELPVQPYNVDVQILAYVFMADACEVGIMTVDLFYRQETATDWNKVTMTPGEEEDVWQAMIGADSLASAKIYYYLRAVDNAGQESILPEDADSSLLQAFSFGVSTG